jgi:predicted transcriptional regulator
MSDKQVAIEAIQRLPEAATLRDISKEIELLAAIRKGEEQADRGQVISVEQLEQNLASWLSKSFWHGARGEPEITEEP